MDAELKDLSKDQTLDTVDESRGDGSGKDKPPLLISDSNVSSRTISAENLLELEKKFAAYVREDVYGTMGRGELPLSEKFLLGFAVVTLVPIRLVIGISLLLLYYLICRLCTLFSVPNREDEQEDYAHMVGWRRAVIVHCGRFLSRARLFRIGFYWISDSRRNLLPVKKLICANECKEQSKEPERPGAIICDHISYLDVL